MDTTWSRLMVSFYGSMHIEISLKSFLFPDSAYFPGRCANVMLKRNGVAVTIGKIGVLHPSVLKNFEVTNPCSVVEVFIEPFV